MTERRTFLKNAGLAAATVSVLRSARGVAEEAKDAPKPAEFAKKIKLGVIGNGGRGAWIANLFKKHGGYEMHAVCDYFQHVADKCGDALGVDKARRFSTLSGYKKLIESGVEAVALETPPYFFPEHAKAAVEAGLHVYSAKPVATDVPGCLQIEAAGKQATAKQRCFLVDYQMPTDPFNIEVRERVLSPEFGKIAYMQTIGTCGGFPDPAKTANYESRLQSLIWCNDVAMGGDYIGNFDIHALDIPVWVLGQRPLNAMGHSAITRANPHGDSRDVCLVEYEFPNGIFLQHWGQALNNNAGDGGLICKIFSQNAAATINYWGKALIRGGAKHYGGGQVANLYEAGAVRNIATFYDSVTGGKFDNPTVKRAVDGALLCILGREAAARHTKMTMDELLKENRKLEVDLTGLKA
jgi:predicted dehydrogenase